MKNQKVSTVSPAEEVLGEIGKLLTTKTGCRTKECYGATRRRSLRTPLMKKMYKTAWPNFAIGLVDARYHAWMRVKIICSALTAANSPDEKLSPLSTFPAVKLQQLTIC